MWYFAISVCLYSIVAVFGQEEGICKDLPFETCYNPLQGHFLSQLTPQGVDEICPKFIDYIACLGKYDDVCGEKAPRKIFPDEGEFKSVTEVIADICDSDALLHTVLTQNLECIKDGLYNDDNNTCYAETRKLAQTVSDTQSEDNSEYDESTYTSLDNCFFHLHSVTCYLEFVSNNCGILAKEAIIEVLHRSYFIQKYCQPEIAQEFNDVIDKVEVREPLRVIFKELIQKIMKKEE